VKYTEDWPNIQFLIPNILEPKQVVADNGEIPLLKLHGSVGWQPFSYQGCVGIPSEHLERLGAKAEVDYPDNGDWTLATNRTMIIPTWFKIFQPGHLFEHLWAQALEVIGKATELIVIGYSFPKADSAAWVLRQAESRQSRQWKFVDRAPKDQPALYDSFESWMSKKDSR
jgi:hypothetical protein